MAKRPFYFFTKDGSALPLALKLKAEGHAVSMAPTPVGQGLIAHSNTPVKGAIVIFDCCGESLRGDQFRRQGHKTIGGHPFEECEVDRPKGAKIMQMGGIRVPPTFPFKAIPDAIKFLSMAKGEWFVKVSGLDTGCASTYDAPDPDAMIRYLKWVKSKGNVQPFELQQKVDGVEVSCNGWFDGKEFIRPFDLTIEEKKFLTGDVGPRTGCESCVVWHSSQDSLAARTILKVEEQLRQAKYVGPIDLNSIVDDEGMPQGLEWTCRLGFDSTQAWMRLFEGDLGEQLEAFAEGALLAWEPTYEDLSANLRVSIPPYPSEDEKALKSIEGFPLDENLLDDPDVDVVDVKEGPVCAGVHGFIGTVSALGNSLKDIRADLLSLAGLLQIQNKQYRMDPINRANRDFAILEKLSLLDHAWEV